MGAQQFSQLARLDIRCIPALEDLYLLTERRQFREVNEMYPGSKLRLPGRQYNRWINMPPCHKFPYFARHLVSYAHSGKYLHAAELGTEQQRGLALLLQEKLQLIQQPIRVKDACFDLDTKEVKDILNRLIVSKE